MSWKKTLLAEVNTWLGFVIDPQGPCVQMARDKHLLVVGILEELRSGKVLSATQIASALGRLQWATTACPLTKPFLQPFWAWKKACLTAGRPSKLIRALAFLLLSLFDQRFRQASPYAPLAFGHGLVTLVHLMMAMPMSADGSPTWTPPPNRRSSGSTTRSRLRTTPGPSTKGAPRNALLLWRCLAP